MPSYSIALSALLAVFPQLKSFQSFSREISKEFIEEDDKIGSFLRFAKRSGIIEHEIIQELESVIVSNKRLVEDCLPPPDLTFKKLIENKGKYLNIDFSVSKLVEKINHLVTESGLGLPSLTTSMFSRLKTESVNTEHKKDMLRSFAFWLGHERSELGPMWNYETLLNLFPRHEILWSENEGSRIAFGLHPRNIYIGQDSVNWLKNSIKDSLVENLEQLYFGYSFEIKEFPSTEFPVIYLDLPKEASDWSTPQSFSRCIRDAIAIAHQISISWSLSEHSAYNGIHGILLTIGIATGNFSALNLDLFRKLLDDKIPGNPILRMTSFTRLSFSVSDIRAIFSCDVIVDDLRVWPITELWNNIYWDFSPALLREFNSISFDKLHDLIWFPEAIKKHYGEDIINDYSSIEIFNRSPQNTLLGIEIAKTFYYKRYFFEALEILKRVLSAEPVNLTARTLRMSIFCNLGVDESKYSRANIYFNRLEKEADIIVQNCNTMHEDFYCDYALGKLAHSVKILRLIKNQGKNINGEWEYNTESNITLTKKDAIKLLHDSQQLLFKGINISATGHRSTYWWVCVTSLKNILETYNDDDIFIKIGANDIFSDNTICKETGKDLFSTLSWLKEDKYYSEESRQSLLIHHLIKAIHTYDDSVLLRVYKTKLLFAYAVISWDFNPYVNAGVAKHTLLWLKEAERIVDVLDKDNINMYSITRLHSEILPGEVIKKNVQKAIKIVEEDAGTLDTLELMKPEENIKTDKVRNLCFLNMFDDYQVKN